MRARNIKPGFFTNEVLGTLDPIVCLTFAGLWCLADRDGILEDRPLRIKGELFPYRENLDINGYLTVLERCRFITRYTHEGESYIQVANFTKHQSPHNTERAKGYPKPTERKSCNGNHLDDLNGYTTVKTPLSNGEVTAQERPDSLIHGFTDSLITDSSTHGTSPLKFQKPSLEEVSQYTKQRGGLVDPQAFIDHYESNGWLVGKAKMKDWKAAIRTWERNARSGQFANGKPAKAPHRPRIATAEELKRYNPITGIEPLEAAQ